MRLIDADRFEAFVSKIEDAEMGYTTGYVDGVTSVLEAIDAAPTVDAVQVVRCSECVHGFPMENGQYTCNRIKVLDVCDPDYFCADGKRKEDAK